ncbi:MAG: glycosyltransferase family 39 protein [Chloroflexi bacterium]|nr:glycosyltransferase family 39 protein [Chloroflexota bacterium]
MPVAETRAPAAHRVARTATPARRSWAAVLARNVLLLLPVLALALAFRLVNLDSYSGLFDEGIRVEQLYLMTWGYRPFRDIFAAQGPLLLDSLYPFYLVGSAVLGQTLVAARVAAVCYSLLGIVALAWLAHQIAGRWAAVSAALVLALSPLYLEGSRLALAEVPALAPAMLSVGAITRYSATGRLRWLILAAAALTWSILMKPITVAAIPAVCIGALGQGWPGWRQLLGSVRPSQALATLRRWSGLRWLASVGVLMVLVSIAIVFLLDFSGVWDQIFRYREASRAATSWSVRKNLVAIVRGFGYEPLTLLPLALLGTVLASATRSRRALPAIVWTLGGVALLLFYSPLHGKHIVVAIPGLALMTGLAPVLLLHLGASARKHGRAGWVRGATVAASLATLSYLAALPPVLARTGDTLKVTSDTDVDPAFEQYADAVRVIQALTTPDDFVVTDHPYLAFLAGRRVPPKLVDTAKSRIEARSLRASEAKALAEAYNPKLVILWSDRLRGLRAFKEWTEDNYQVVKIYNRRDDLDRLLYLRRDADFASARPLAGGTAGGTAGVADFAGVVRLDSVAVDQAEMRSGDGTTVTLAWELLQPTPVDYHVVTYLRDARGEIMDEQEESLGGGSSGTSEWTPGRWVVQSSFVKSDRDLEPGDYRVTVGLYDSRARSFAPVALATGSRASTVAEGNEVDAARITVSRR